MLQIQNLTKTYAGQRGTAPVQALNGVDLTISPGLFGLLGQNGAGKSSLMRTIATLQPADSGSIFFNDIDVLTQPDELRRVLGYLPQEFGVYPTVTAEELLTHIADMKGISNRAERRESVDEMLQRVNLWEVRRKLLSTYSGGMRQRFGIAQALIGDPQLIIVDEPTAGLDPTERNRFYNLLAQIGGQIVVLLSTHVVEDVSTLCHQIAIMGQGHVLKTGSPAQLTAELAGRLWELPIAASELASFQNRFNVVASRFLAGQMHITVVADEQPQRQFRAKIPVLEDAYFTTLSAQARPQSI